jgi:hypothetical protein
MVDVVAFKKAFKEAAEKINKDIRWKAPKGLNKIWHTESSIAIVGKFVDKLGDPPTLEQVTDVIEVIKGVSPEGKLKYGAALNELMTQMKELQKEVPLLQPGCVPDMKKKEAGAEKNERKLLKGLVPLKGLEGFDDVVIHGPADIDPDKISALAEGFKLVKNLGFKVPPMKVHFAQATEKGVMEKARNVAFMTTAGETEKDDAKQEINLFLSAEGLLVYNPKGKDSDEQPKGAGSMGKRGVPDQAADVAFEKAKEGEKERAAKKAYASAIVAHELGHILHAQGSPDEFWNMKIAPEAFTKTNWADLAPDVSEYATGNVLEFVAEVFCGRAQGFIYSEKLLNKYYELGGQ